MSRVTKEALAAVMCGRKCRLDVPYTHMPIDVEISANDCERIRDTLNGEVVVIKDTKCLWIMGTDNGEYETGIREYM